MGTDSNIDNNTDDKKPKERYSIVKSFKKEWEKSKATTLVYLILRILVVVVLILEAFGQNWYNVLLCVLTLVLFLLPDLVESRMKIELPDGLEIIIICFIFAAEILGEISEFYIHFQRWDMLLHTLNGFLAAAIGLSLIDILNRNDRFSLSLSPKYVALSAFTFSMTIGVLWEFFEYGMDKFFGTDMQKDTYIDTITSVELNPDGHMDPQTVDIQSVVINGQEWAGYLDIGLMDTMADMFVNFIGAVVFSIFGYFYIKGQNKRINKFVGNIVPYRMEDKNDNENEIKRNGEDA